MNVVEDKENWPRAYSTQPFAAAQALAEYSSEALMEAWLMDFMTTVVPMITETAVMIRTVMRAMKPFFSGRAACGDMDILYHRP